MSQISKSMIIVIVIVLLFNFAGLIAGSTTGFVLGQFGVLEPQDFSTSAFWLAIKVIFTTIAVIGVVGGITIGALRGGSPIETAKEIGAAGLGLTFLAFGEDIFIIIAQLAEMNVMLSVMIGSPLIVSWLMGAFDWFRRFS